MKYDPHLTIGLHQEVYPPSEDSIFLIESFDVIPGERILELGCGSGVVSIHCARNGGVVTCGDLNPNAVGVTKENAIANDIELNVIETDVFSNIRGRYDTIVFNLPYLPVTEEGELARAWSGGEDGLGPLPRILEGLKDYLNPDGRLLIVVSSLMDRERLNHALSRYQVRRISELPLFFEVLSVLEIRLKGV